MAIPSGILTTILTFGPYTAPDGTLDKSWSATVTLDRELFWQTSPGQYSVVEQIPLTTKVDPDGTARLRLPQTDQAGYVDAAGNPITDGFRYGLTWTTQNYSKRPITSFELTSVMGDIINGDRTYDADRLHQGSSPSTPTTPGSVVTRITLNGQSYTGDVNLPDAVAGLGASTVEGITNAKPIGKALLLAADLTAARTALGLERVSNTNDSEKPISLLVQQALNGLVTSAALAAALQGLVDLATFTQALATKLDASTQVARYCVKVNGTWQPRPVTAAKVPVFYLSYDGSNPPGGGTESGGAGMVEGVDVVLLGP